jgi:hypothetical protein
MSNRHKEFAEQLLSVRDTTRDLVTSVLMDAWPGHAAVVDFGIDSQKHYEALYFPIREAEIMPKALDAALGHGEKLTAMTREAASNPHKDVQFHTSWDVILGRPMPEKTDRSMRFLDDYRLPLPEGISPHDVVDFWKCQGLTPPWEAEEKATEKTKQPEVSKNRDNGIES